MLHLRLIAPDDCTQPARSLLAGHDGVTNLVVLPKAGIRPAGDVILADVAREAANEVLDELRALGLTERGSIAVENVDLSISAGADRAEDQAPGRAEDAVVWAELSARTRRSRRCPRPTWCSSRSPPSWPGSRCCWTRPSWSSAR